MFVIRKLLTLLVIFLWALPFSVRALELTDRETEWLSQHPVIRYAPAPNYPPIEYVDDTKRHLGITADLLGVISGKVGLKVEVKRYASWDEVINATRKGQIDLLGSAAQTPQRANYLEFTDPYITLPTVIYMRKAVGESAVSLSELMGKRVVVIESYASTQFLEENYPELLTIKVPEIETGLRMVSYGMADAIITSQAAAVHYIGKHRLTNLKVAGESEITWHLRFAARKDWPELASIIQKALDEIAQEEKEALYRRWMKLDYPSQLLDEEQLRMLLWMMGGALFIGLLFWNIMQGKQLKGHADSLADIRAHKHELESQLARLQRVDPLSGITNRRAWLEESGKELARFHRYGNSFAVVLFFVEGYKSLLSQNEKAEAEELMHQVIAIVVDEIREHDICGDMGEGHLAILLQSVDEATAEKVVRRVNHRVAQVVGTMAQRQHCQTVVRFSIVVPRAVTVSIEELMQQAEAKLYVANS